MENQRLWWNRDAFNFPSFYFSTFPCNDGTEGVNVFRETGPVFQDGLHHIIQLHVEYIWTQARTIIHTFYPLHMIVFLVLGVFFFLPKSNLTALEKSWWLHRHRRQQSEVWRLQLGNTIGLVYVDIVHYVRVWEGVDVFQCVWEHDLWFFFFPHKILKKQHVGNWLRAAYKCVCVRWEMAAGRRVVGRQLAVLVCVCEVIVEGWLGWVL